jgi:hypothetical protein
MWSGSAGRWTASSASCPDEVAVAPPGCARTRPAKPPSRPFRQVRAPCHRPHLSSNRSPSHERLLKDLRGTPHREESAFHHGRRPDHGDRDRAQHWSRRRRGACFARSRATARTIAQLYRTSPASPGDRTPSPTMRTSANASPTSPASRRGRSPSASRPAPTAAPHGTGIVSAASSRRWAFFLARAVLPDGCRRSAH